MSLNKTKIICATQSLSDLFNLVQSRSDNGKVNIQREKLFLEKINEKDTNDTIIKDILEKINKHYSFIKCSSKGGMGNSYDFIFDVKDKMNVELKVLSLNVELKVLSGNELPQLGDVYIQTEQFHFIKDQYNKFTESWLEELKNIKSHLSIKSSLPSLEELRKNIGKLPGKSSCNFLEELYKTVHITEADKLKKDDTRNKKNKTKYVADCSKRFISNFINVNIDSINTELIKKAYEEKMGIKDLMIIYNKKTKNTTIYKFDNVKLDITKVTKSVGRNKLFTGLDVHFQINNANQVLNEKVTLLLRWKNQSGVFNPCWSMKEIKTIRKLSEKL